MSTPKDGQWTSELFTDFFKDPIVCVLGYFAPCVLYGQTAEKVHGGDLISHCLKFYLYSCICACGLVAGPTRQALRSKYHLNQQPECLAAGANSDCIVYTVPCVNCFATCQDSREATARGFTAPIDPVAFSWNAFEKPAPAPAPAAPAATEAPAAQEMK